MCGKAPGNEEEENVDITVILKRALELEASDIFIIAGLPVTYKVNGRQRREGEALKPDDTQGAVAALYALCGRRAHSVEAGDDDFSFAMPGFGRFRASVLHQRGTLAAVLRVIRFGLPDPRELEIPDPVLATARLLKGLVLVTGAAGNGKSTTLACLIDAINHSREGHIITMVDPI